MADAVLQARDLHSFYGDSHILHGVNFTVPFPATLPAIMTIHDLSPWKTAPWVDGAWRARTCCRSRLIGSTPVDVFVSACILIAASGRGMKNGCVTSEARRKRSKSWA